MLRDWEEKDLNIFSDQTAGWSHYKRPIVNWADNWNKFIGRSAIVRYITKGVNFSQELLVLEMREVLTEYLPQEIAEDTELLLATSGISEPTLRTYNEGGFVSNDIKVLPLLAWLKERGYSV